MRNSDYILIHCPFQILIFKMKTVLFFFKSKMILNVFHFSLVSWTMGHETLKCIWKCYVNWELSALSSLYLLSRWRTKDNEKSQSKTAEVAFIISFFFIFNLLSLYSSLLLGANQSTEMCFKYLKISFFLYNIALSRIRLRFFLGFFLQSRTVAHANRLPGPFQYTKTVKCTHTLTQYVRKKIHKRRWRGTIQGTSSCIEFNKKKCNLPDGDDEDNVTDYHRGESWTIKRDESDAKLVRKTRSA